MTTIKLNCNLKINGCSDCPFINYNDVIDFGEITGEYEANCLLLEKDNDCLIYPNDKYTNYYVRDDKLPNCPIISVEEEENG